MSTLANVTHNRQNTCPVSNQPRTNISIVELLLAMLTATGIQCCFPQSFVNSNIAHDGKHYPWITTSKPEELNYRLIYYYLVVSTHRAFREDKSLVWGRVKRGSGKLGTSWQGWRTVHLSVGLSVSVCRVYCGKTADSIWIPFGWWVASVERWVY